MAKPKLNADQQARRKRLAEVVGWLVDRGQTQRQIATALSVPTQYLSDAKTGQRAITEQFARRVADVYKVSFAWLMNGEGQKSTPQLTGAPGTTTSGITLPVLSTAVEGDPAASLEWDGSQIVVAGVPAAIATRAQWPYVLRFDGHDNERRLLAGDLVLVTEPEDAQCELMIVKHRSSLRMARHKKGAWHSLMGRQSIPKTARVVGCVRGIVWAPLS